MEALITEQERIIAIEYGMTDKEYLAKRQAYCHHQGQSWTELSELNSADIHVISRLGQEAKTFHETKLGILAEDIVRNFVE